jgi:hypothetical protein
MSTIDWICCPQCQLCSYFTSANNEQFGCNASSSASAFYRVAGYADTKGRTYPTCKEFKPQQQAGSSGSSAGGGFGGGAGSALGSVGNLVGGAGALAGGAGSVLKGFGKLMSSSIDGMASMVNSQEKHTEELKAELKDKLDSVCIEGTSDEMANALNLCFINYASIPAKHMDIGSDARVTTAELQAARTALLEKAEFGIIKLRKADPDMADFFQKKLEEIKNPPKKGLFGFGKKK